MKPLLLVIAVVAMATSVGCVNLKRSRDLGNPNIAPEVTAVQVCSNCHGVDGNSKSPNFPRLAGQKKDYLVTQLLNFQSHARSDQAARDYMWGVAGFSGCNSGSYWDRVFKCPGGQGRSLDSFWGGVIGAHGLTKDQIDGLADYFSQQPVIKHSGLPDFQEMFMGRAKREQSLAAGKAIYENGIAEKKIPACHVCHGPDAHGLAAFPRTASQHSAYIEKQLAIFKSNVGRPHTPMEQVARDISKKEMRDVALYLESLP
ncbi:c-type cytochrome [uncultured Thiodictyon sp.]|uniref:c-type cytochrome n=1 Tax=uncultured Thiodictyon sp. TaxID=1846217 RepID=UPI0025FF1FE1|nr:c-type cytochrome [uncultured Thiodictyon sp.]